MMEISGPLWLLGAIASSTPAGSIDIKTLWNTAPHIRGDVFVELRCRGLSPDAARKRIDKRYSKREASIQGVMGTPDAPEILPIGRRCPYYAGSATRYDRLLGQIELRIRSGQ